MNIELREGRPDDAAACGAICYKAFKMIAESHGFAPDIPSLDVAVANFIRWLAKPGFSVLVAGAGGRVVGSNVLDERSTIVGLGPITVDPTMQDRGVGRRLMEGAIQRTDVRGGTGLRLVQSAYHVRSLSLYSSLGFEVREPLVNMQGPPVAMESPGRVVRSATANDLGGCDALCLRVHGHDRSGEVQEAIERGTAQVVEHEGRVTGYVSALGFYGHAVGERNVDLMALIGAAKEFAGPGFLLPSRNGELLRWCLERGLKVVQPMNLMSIGDYQDPAGPFLPSITY